MVPFLGNVYQVVVDKWVPERNGVLPGLLVGGQFKAASGSSRYLSRLGCIQHSECFERNPRRRRLSKLPL